MCLIGLAIGAHPDIPLLIASNRDEFFDRPTAPLSRWALPNGEEAIGGRDLRDGGTWLGVSAKGRVAMLTNVRSAQPPSAARSRGELASLWLSGEFDWPALLAHVQPADHGGFNLVVGDARSGFWGWVSNRNPAHPHEGQEPALHSQRLQPGIYGFSNASLHTDWPKTQLLKEALRASLAQPDAALRQHTLLQALGNCQPVADAALPPTGLALATERALSSPFVRMPDTRYGTRSSLVVRATQAVDGLGTTDWQVNLDEWTHTLEAANSVDWSAAQQRSIELVWQAPSP